jgi:hypothetical protein
MNFLNTPELRERRLVHVPLGRFGEAVEIARAALFCLYLLYCTKAHAEKELLQWPVTKAALSM